MAIFEFKLPDLGEGIVTSEIVELHVKVDQTVEEDDILIAMMTDKATVELPSPVDGKIVAIAGKVGEQINVGATLISFEVEGETSSTTASANTPSSQKQQPAEVIQSVKASQTPAAPISNTENSNNVINSDILASPSLRRKAQNLNIDLSLVIGSGPAGRITHDDLDGFIASGGAYISNAQQHRGAVTQGDSKKPKTGVSEIPLRGVRRKIAEAMAHSKRTIPHYTYVEEVDLTDLEKLRVQLNTTKNDDQQKLTLLPFLIKAITLAIVKFPQCNSHYNGETGIITQYDAAHIGMATNTPTGLMVPVIKHAEILDIWQYATKIIELSEKARSGTATREELGGSTITLTSLGKIGGIVTTPIINAPEVCIIGNNKMVERPMVIDGEIVIRKMMNISGSFDHRIVDGYDGAMMIQYIKQLLEVPATLFMGAQ